MIDKSKPLVSVIIPVYNVEKYLADCIDSVICQNYENLEIIIVDDGTPDKSGEIADSYIAKDERIRVIHQKNSGVASARNHGFDVSTGEFIIYIDSDDWISKDHVSYLMSLHEKTGSDMCMSTGFFIQKHDSQVEKEKVDILSPAEAAALLLSPGTVIGSYNKLYKKSYLLENNIRQNETLFSGEGLNYTVIAAQHANSVAVGNRKVYYYRRNVSESATTKFNIKMFTNNELSLDILKKDKVVSSEKFDTMLELFRVHLVISGLLAIYTYAAPKKYINEYKRWKSIIRHDGIKLIGNKYVPFKSKIRIIGVNISPRLWASLANKKRTRIFKNSVRN